MIKAYQKNEQLLVDIHQSNVNDSNFRLWWLGQSGYLVQWKGQHLLIDPYLSDSLTKKYALTEKPHIRMSELVLDPADLDFIDVVTSSHNHTDHLDGETLIPLIQKNPDMPLVIPEANRAFVAKRIQQALAFPIGLDVGEHIEQAGFCISAVAAAHEKLEKDERGRHKFLGYIITFGSWTIYHSGDTILYNGMVNVLRKFKIDVAILPINGKETKRKVAGNLNAKEAATLAKEIGARIVIPCHYDMFTFNTADPVDFVSEAKSLNQRYAVLSIGEKWSAESLLS